MNATPGKPGALICLGNYATVIPTPIEGEGGGDKTKLSNSFFFPWKPWDSDPTPQMEL